MPCEKPMLFNTEMVQAILKGRKIQTRRVINPQPPKSAGKIIIFETLVRKPGFTPDEKTLVALGDDWGFEAPYQPSDILWVRETWQKLDNALVPDLSPGEYVYVYRASENGKAWESETENWKWRPSIHMPREAARTFLRVTGVRVERLQDITTEGAKAEGFETIGAFREAFDKMLLKKDGSDWYTNPWVWVIEFKKGG